MMIHVLYLAIYLDILFASAMEDDEYIYYSVYQVIIDNLRPCRNSKRRDCRYYLHLLRYIIFSPLHLKCLKSISHTLSKAKNGYLYAETAIGVMYMNTQSNLTLFYLRGIPSICISQDYKKNVYWLELAADQGDVIAMYNLRCAKGHYKRS